MLFSWHRRPESPFQRPSWPYGPPAMDREQARYAEVWAGYRLLRLYSVIGGLAWAALIFGNSWLWRGSLSLTHALFLVAAFAFWSMTTALMSVFRCPRCGQRFFRGYYPGVYGKPFGGGKCANCDLPYRHEPAGDSGLALGGAGPLGGAIPAVTRRVELAPLPAEIGERLRAWTAHLWASLTWRNIGAYPGRHWRGEFNLPQSFIVDGILVCVLFVGATRWIIARIGFPDGAAAYWTLFGALWLVFGVMTGWQTVGIWRSARKGERAAGIRYSRSTWIGGGVFLVFFVFISGLELLVQQVTARNESPPAAAAIEPHYLRLQADQAQLVLTGGIGDDATEETRNWLNAYPGVRFIVLDSPGGVPDEARRLAALIGVRGLAAYVPRRCAAECVTAFLAGNPRMIAPGARLGLGREAADRSGDELRWRLVNAGVATWFADDAAAKPAGTLWWPTDDELLRGKVIAAITFAPAQELAPTLPTEQP